VGAEKLRSGYPNIPSKWICARNGFAPEMDLRPKWICATAALWQMIGFGPTCLGLIGLEPGRKVILNPPFNFKLRRKKI
jgi:hypothetical protein